MNNKMQAKSKRNELVKSGAYDGRYRQRVSKSKKRSPRKTEKLKTTSEIEEVLYNQKSSDVIGHVELDYFKED